MTAGKSVPSTTAAGPSKSNTSAMVLASHCPPTMWLTTSAWRTPPPSPPPKASPSTKPMSSSRPRCTEVELYTTLSRGRDANHVYAVCDPDTEHAHSHTGASPTATEVLGRVAQRERPDWAAHSVLRRAMNHAEEPDVIRNRVLEVVRALQRLPDGADRDALHTYRAQLAAVGRTVEQLPRLAVSQRAPNPALSPRPRGPSIEL